MDKRGLKKKFGKTHNNKPYRRDDWKSAITEKTVNLPEHSDKYEEIHLPKRGRPYTINVAIPVSILGETCISEHQRRFVINLIARFCTIFGVDEIVIYNDHCWKGALAEDVQGQDKLIEKMCTVLQYLECPQYLRKSLCPMSPHLTDAGTFNPLNAPHHLKANQWCAYREGIVVGRNGKAGSLINIGLGRDVLVKDMEVSVGARVTVKLEPAARVMKSPCGELVSPHEPREKHGLHWGYSVRVAESLAQVFSESEYAEGYDFLIGTSDKGKSVSKLQMPIFRNVMIVFGGVDGLEKSISVDKTLTASKPENLFNAYVNVCKQQQARTIRTEEAVPLALAALLPKLQEPYKKSWASALVVLLETLLTPATNHHLGTGRLDPQLMKNTSLPEFCWQREKYEPLEDCQPCSGLELNAASPLACSVGHYRQKIKCEVTGVVFRRCDRAVWLEEQHFLEFEMFFAFVAVLGYILTTQRQRALQERVMIRISQQLAAST